MISPLPSPTFTASCSNPGRPRTEDENPLLFPKHEANQLSQLTPKPCHMQPSKRAPLNPLSASDLENRYTRNAQSTDCVSYHSLVTPVSHPDLRILLPEHPVSCSFCGMQRGGSSDALVCSWPPPVPTRGIGRSLHSTVHPAGRQASQCGRLHSSDENDASRDPFLQRTSTWHPADPVFTAPTTIMPKPIRTSGWKSENLLQPIRSRSTSLPSVRRPPGELWRSDSGPTKVAHGPVDVTDLLLYPTPPPGLTPRRHELRRSSSVSDLLPHGSMSLSLAVGSQPLQASEPTKAVPPIGAERTRVVSITPLKSNIRDSSVTKLDDVPRSTWRSPPPLPQRHPKWKGEAGLLDPPSQAKVQPVSSHEGVTMEDLERLLRHATRNKHAPKIISPLSPLRATPALDLSVDPTYQIRMPPPSSYPSPRYFKCPPRRARTVCDGYQPFDLDTTCVHCLECKRDSVGKRLLAFRCRQQQTRQIQRNRSVAPPCRAATASVVLDDDRIALAGRIREAFAYEMDDEEKSLWEEVAAVTGVGPVTFSRAGAPCATATQRDDITHEDGLGMPDEGLLGNASATLFRDVSVY